MKCTYISYIFIQSIIHSSISIAPSWSPLLLRGDPDTARILCLRFTLKHHRQLRVKDLPKVPTTRNPTDKRQQTTPHILYIYIYSPTSHVLYIYISPIYKFISNIYILYINLYPIYKFLSYTYISYIYNLQTIITQPDAYKPHPFTGDRQLSLCLLQETA